MKIRDIHVLEQQGCYVLHEMPGQVQPYVTHLVSGDGSLYHGHYFSRLTPAIEDLKRRAKSARL